MGNRKLAKIRLPQDDRVLPDYSDVIAIDWGTTREGGTTSAVTSRELEGAQPPPYENFYFHF